jgi:hypothetical protein
MWYSVFNSYENPHDWHIFYGTTIRSDPTKNNKDRRIKIRISMITDEIEGQISRLPSREREQSRRE